MRRTWVVGFAAALLVLAGCGGETESDDTPAPGAQGGGSTMPAGHDHSGGAVDATCSPTGNTVTVVAQNIAFQSTCLAAPANAQFTVSFENKDTIGHNIVFLESHTATQVMFRADIFPGPTTRTFTAGPFRPGTYAFHCEVHPNQMSGAFVVK
ncbi:MAG: cupredoxin domain-containing protein [Acidimicrobiales bacterium]